ncbi:AbrB/MazE/SpoVT family DNA-binding domain-containing protein [Desulfoferrobacter suflitae]|uniref:AbrB/MazE/SpoVT family DNA-binding domain-containing protein n=1 Tax=Desulfoferrobacter suflitae TaxID=2865782 RepID=UPI002164D322|nr:AbrB/MazE/SpoVT family DNA-binding domain-containing protein [Desulfoferrobacter suflitae]MCK8603808.1 AbrB/MazE/SpoVT family DNA-binding domain-containing protein [Desulfoferrobacter suflitae]
MYAKVSKKAQITIPKSIRKKLNIGENGAVLFVVENGEVKLKGVAAGAAESLAGSLKGYADRYEPLDKIREKIQEEIARNANREHELNNKTKK